MTDTPAGGTIVERILEGNAPEQVRRAAARGALPLPRSDLTRLFVALLEDPDENIRQDATQSLAAMSHDAIRDVLADGECAPEVLVHFTDTAFKQEDLAELIVFHERLPDSALEKLAGRGNARVIELVLTNQEKLLATPGILDKLTVNPALRADQRGRILELLDRVAKAIDDDDDEATEENAMTAEEAARLLDVDVGELFAASEILGGKELAEADDPGIRSAYQKIVTLNAAQKAVLAMKGGREERMILIHDTNKVVALSVVKNPRLTENDVEQIAMMRNVVDDVLRTIGTNREWIKSYQVVTNLVKNPRTPPGISTNFVSRLMNKDLKNLSRDRNVPEIIRRMAKRTFETRTQQRGGLKKKG